MPKRTKFAIFLKGRFSVMSGLMDIISGVFSETNVRLLKMQFHNFSQNIAKVINVKCQKLLKTQRPLTKKWTVLRRSNYMYLIELYKSLSEWS